MNLTTSHLEAIAHVASELSFTRAAKSLHITQSALSYRIAEAERQLGVTVFRRTTRSVLVTPEGRPIIEIAKESLHELELTMDRLEALVRGVGRPVHLAALPSIAAAVLPDVLAQFRQTNPEVMFDLSVGHSMVVTEMVIRGQADFGIVAGSYEKEAIAFDSLVEDKFVCLVPIGHRFAEKSSVTWRDLTTERFVMPPTNSSLYPVVVRAFKQSGANPTDVIVGQDLSTTAGLVAAGLGLAAVPSITLPLTRFASVVERPLVAPVAVRQMGILRAEGRRLSVGAEMLLKRCRHVLVQKAAD